MYRTLLYDTLPPNLFASVSPLTSRFPLTMAAGSFGPYHRLWTDDATSKRKAVTPTSGGVMPVLGFVSYHWGRELLVTPPPRRICRFVFFGKKIHL
jgi:hypothetical protein